jgi:tropomyosin
MTKDQEIVSLQHKISTLESSLDKAELALGESKGAKDEGENHKTLNDTLGRKIALLEEELEDAEKKVRETTDK